MFGGNDSFRDPLIIEADEFIAVKGYKAKGKRLTTFAVETINELEPTKFQQIEDITTISDDEKPIVESEIEPTELEQDTNEGDIIDEITGQMKLF